ncbi:MAG: cell division protein FtsZ [Bacteroidota bacterium]|nr:cell division protein FtsZ [Bacteroidota bacterium]
MAEELINFDLPTDQTSIIKVVGVGGGGGNAVNHMFKHGIKDVNFILCNTDAQALANSPISVKLQLGASLTEGRGAGNKPEVGRQAAIESIDQVLELLSKNTKMVFITAGMGGGTGTGAAPVIAKAAKEMGLLTVGIITIPFRFEGQQRINQAIEGIRAMQEYVDSLLIINNEKLREMYGNLKISEAFSKADDVLAIAAKGIAEIITVHGYINVDFADVQTVMANSGVAIMGSSSAEGEGRALKAIQDALSSPLLNNNDITGAKSILLNITSGTEEVSMDEVGEITDYLTRAVAKDTLIIWGTGNDENLGEKISVTVIATGFEANTVPELYTKKKNTDRILLKDSSVSKDFHSDDTFVVKDKTSQELKNEKASQSFIDFEITDKGKSKVVIFEDVAKNHEPEFINEGKQSTDRIKSIKSKHEGIRRSQGFNSKEKDENIESMENQPAYIRRNIKIESFKKPETSSISRFTLSEDEQKNIHLREDNAYLHDNVD